MVQKSIERTTIQDTDGISSTCSVLPDGIWGMSLTHTMAFLSSIWAAKFLNIWL